MLDLAEHTLSLDGVEVLVFAPLQMALYLFMCENSNTARGQEPIDMLRDAFQYRDKIAECLQRCDVRNRKAEGLSALILPETEWPEHWLKEGNNMSFSDSRNKNLGSALSRINKEFKKYGLSRSSFALRMQDERKSSTSTRWVDIDPKRLRIVE